MNKSVLFTWFEQAENVFVSLQLVVGGDGLILFLVFVLLSLKLFLLRLFHLKRKEMFDLSQKYFDEIEVTFMRELEIPKLYSQI